MNKTRHIHQSLLQQTVTAETVFFGSLLVLIVLLPFDEGGNGHIVQLVTQLLVLFCATIWAIHVFRERQFELRLYWIDLCVLGFLLWCLISSLFSAYAYASILELIKIFSYAVFFFLCRILFPIGTQRSTVVLLTILGSSLIQSGFAWYRYLTLPAKNIHGGFFDPNNLACFLVTGITLGLSAVLFSPLLTSAKQRKYVRHAMIGMSLAVLLITLLAIQSRGAVLSLLGTGFVLCTLKKKHLGLIFVLFVSLITFLPLPGGSLFQRLQKRDDPFAYQRIDIWQSSFTMAADHPRFGVGAGMFAYYGHQYNFPVEHQIARYGKILNAAHNDLLQIAAELGVIACLVFISGIVLAAYSSFRQLRSSCLKSVSVGAQGISGDPKVLPWQTVAASMGLLGIVLHAQVSNVLHPPAIAMIGAILLTILLDGDAPAVTTQITFVSSWYWYGALALTVLYILVPVILYPFLAHVQYLKYFEERRENPVDAIEYVHSAIAFVPLHATYHQAIGEFHLSRFRTSPTLEDFYQSYTYLTEAIRLNPIHADAYSSLAELHREMFYQKLRWTSIQKQAASNALREYRRALRYEPYTPFLRMAMAALHADIKEFEQAVALLQEAVEIEPNFVRGYQMLSMMLEHLNRPREAEAASQQAISILKRYGIQPHGSPYVQSLLRPLSP